MGSYLSRYLWSRHYERIASVQSGTLIVKGGSDGRGAGDGDGRGVVGAGEVTVPAVGVTATGGS